jgi:hypothetical protein
LASNGIALREEASGKEPHQQKKRTALAFQSCFSFISPDRKAEAATQRTIRHEDASEFCSLSFFPKTVNICGIAAGLLTRLRIDAFPVAQWQIVVPLRGLQQRVLFLIFTGFPFHPAKAGTEIPMQI